MKNIFHSTSFLPNGEVDRRRVERAANKVMAPPVHGMLFRQFHKKMTAENTNRCRMRFHIR